MLRIPGPDDLGNRPTARPSLAVASYDAGGRDLEAPGQAQAQLGKTMVGIGADIAQEVDKLDTLKAEDAWNRYKNAALDATIGDNGVLKKQAGDAVNGDLLGTVTKTLRQTRQQILDSLANDQQKLKFTQRADLTDLQTKHQVITHVVAETNKYQQIVFDGSQAAAQAQVRAAPTDPGVFAGAMATVMGQADAYLKNLGITDAAAQAKVKDQISDNLWKTRIDTVMYNNPILADAMFRANQDQIKSPEVRLQLQARTRETSILVNASNEADKLIAETRVKLSQPDVANGGMMTVGGVEAPLPKGVPPEEAGAFRAAEAARKRGEKFVIAGDYQGDTAFATNGLPNSRDIAAQLPIMLSQVDKVADRIYGKDQGNPDRAAFIQRMQSEVKAKVAADVQGLNAIQREAQGDLLNVIMGFGPAPAGQQTQGGMMQVSQGAAPGQTGGLQKVTSLSQIQSNPQLLRSWQLLDPAAKVAMANLITHNQTADDKGDPVLFRDLFNRIHLPPGTPDKIDFYQQIIQPDVANRLSMAQINQLRQEIDRDETPGGRSLNQLRVGAGKQVELYFKTNPMFTAQPDRQIMATMKWQEDAAKKIDEYVAAKKDVRSLFMLDSPDSIVSQKYLQTYINSTPAQGLAQGAADVKAGTKEPLAFTPDQIKTLPQLPGTIKTKEEAKAWMESLPPETRAIRDENGNPRWIPGRKPKTAATQPPVTTMTPTGQIRQDPARTSTGQIRMGEVQ